MKPPNKTITRRVVLHTFDRGKYTQEDINKLFEESGAEFMEFTGDGSWEYVDIELVKYEIIDNPNYQKQLSNYNEKVRLKKKRLRERIAKMKQELGELE